MKESISRGSRSSAAYRETFYLLAEYEKRFLRAAECLPLRRPWVKREQKEILSKVQSCLGIRKNWIPNIETKLGQTTFQEDYIVEHLQASTWSGVCGAADLYLPRRSRGEAWPVVLLACGHGAGGKRAPRYRRMAEHLVRHEIAVLIGDNIGQGERTVMGHRDVVDVFACGLSLQGLIVMESMGWLRWLQKDPRFDRGRIAAIGNSGGGAITLFLGALCAEELAAVSSSAYPCTFDFIARKEKKHCHCNLLPHVVGELEMWQVYGCIAPKPLLIFQGTQDHFFPGDLFSPLARKVATAYEYFSAGSHFESRLIEGEHRWDEGRRTLLTEFLCRALCVSFDRGRILEDGDLPELPACFGAWPAPALTADALARQLSGHRGRPARHLLEVFRPECGLAELEELSVPGMDLRQIVAQFEAFLKKADRESATDQSRSGELKS